METTEFIWMDDKLVPWNDATTHILTHSLHYGSAVFEGIRCYETPNGTAIFRLKDHVKRLLHSAEVMRMKPDLSEQEIFDAIVKTVKENKLKAGYIRPIFYYGYGKMGLGVKDAPLHFSVSCWPWGAYLGDNAVRVKIPDVIRLHPKSTVNTAKISGVYFNSILAGEAAKEAGYDEALLLDYKGNIAEGPGENIFIAKDGVLITPDDFNILPGITRDSIMKIAKDNNIKVEIKTLTPDDVFDADEAFFVGTAAEVSPIESVNDKTIGSDSRPVSEKLKQLYMDIVKGNNDSYSEWLTIV